MHERLGRDVEKLYHLVTALAADEADDVGVIIPQE